jgi:hypothetical protein
LVKLVTESPTVVVGATEGLKQARCTATDEAQLKEPVRAVPGLGLSCCLVRARKVPVVAAESGHDG